MPSSATRRAARVHNSAVRGSIGAAMAEESGQLDAAHAGDDGASPAADIGRAGIFLESLGRRQHHRQPRCRVGAQLGRVDMKDDKEQLIATALVTYMYLDRE